MIYFSLSTTLYAARYDQVIILLDVENDHYLSLIDDAATYLTYILENPLIKNENNEYSFANQDLIVDTATLNNWINTFTNKGFITQSTQLSRKRILRGPTQPGGLQEYQWDTKTDWKPFSKASLWDIFHSYWKLICVYRVMKKKKIRGLFDLVKKSKLSLGINNIQQKEIDKLIAAVDAATILYPQKTYCLVWATTFTLMARSKGWPCQLAIGIQSNPFYAHAWAELQGKVIGDDPQVSEALAVICKQPEEH